MGLFEKGARSVKKIFSRPKQEVRSAGVERAETPPVTLKRGIYRESAYDLNEWEIEKEEIRRREQTLLSGFFEKPINVPPIPAEITQERMRRWEGQDMELHYLPGEDMPRDRELKSWKNKPSQWFYDQIASGKLPSDSAKLPAGWFVIYAGQKPSYENGKRVYVNHPCASALVELNWRGIITQIMLDKSILDHSSAFGLHPNDFDKPEVINALANAIDVRPDQFSLPSGIVWNIIANLHHPEWWETDAFEWLKDKMKSGGRLFCDFSNDSSASYVCWGDKAGCNVGFRPSGRLS